MTGAVVDRRVVLMSLGALGWLAGCARKMPREAMSFDEFVTELLPMANASVARGVRDQPRYLDEVAKLAARCGWPSLTGRTRHLVEQHPVIISLLEIPARQSFPMHDHQGYCALMRALSGHAIVRSYDAVRTGQEASRVQLARRADESLRPGDIAIAGHARANIHGIEAREDTHIVDIFTIYRPGPRSRLVDIVGENSDGTFDARLGAVL